MLRVHQSWIILYTRTQIQDINIFFVSLKSDQPDVDSSPKGASYPINEMGYRPHPAKSLTEWVKELNDCLSLPFIYTVHTLYSLYHPSMELFPNFLLQDQQRARERQQNLEQQRQEQDRVAQKRHRIEWAQQRTIRRWFVQNNVLWRGPWSLQSAGFEGPTSQGTDY